MLRRVIRGILLTVIAAGVLGWLVYAFWPRPISVELAEVTRGDLRVSVTQDGKTRIRERYVISAPVPGQLKRIELRPGDAVTQGETVIAYIQPQIPPMLDSRELAQAEARVKAAEAALRRSERAIEATEASLKFAVAELSRAKGVARDQVISRSELEGFEMRFRMAQAVHEQARLGQDMAKFELEQARAALLFSRPQSAEAELPADLEIRAPITGRVFRVFQESTKLVAASTPLVEIGDPADLEVEMDVLSTDAVQIKPGDPAWLEHWGGDHDLASRVRLVEPSGFTKISALGVEEQRVNVILDIIAPAEERTTLGDGFRVEARVVLWEGKGIVKVPASALFRSGQRWSVFVIQADRAVLRDIDVGHRNDLEFEVLKGLEPGERVVVHPSESVQDGIRVQEKTPGTPKATGNMRSPASQYAP